MATGESYHSLAFHFRTELSTVSGIVKETTRIIWECLWETYMPVPSRELMIKWEREFFDKWDFPNCFGSLDGKHIRIRNPRHSGSMYHNHKQYFSIVLQRLADANCKFTAIDVGAYGRQRDGGILRELCLGRCLENGRIEIPPPKLLPSTNIVLPYIILGDEAYPLTSYLMRPFPRQDLNEPNKIFNYRLSRARRCIECAFGILLAEWRILTAEIDVSVLNCEQMIKTACLLHNIIIEEEGLSFEDIGEDVQDTPLWQGVERNVQRANRGTNISIEIRNKFCLFFNSPEGSVEWHRNLLNQTIVNTIE